MNAVDIMQANRAILAHFDSYSCALLFVRWAEGSLLWPAPLAEGATPMDAPDGADAAHDAEAVLRATIARCGLNPAEVIHAGDFQQWLRTPDGPVRIHLLRFTTPDAPKGAVEAHGGAFRHMTQLRGAAMSELLMLREVFNLFVGGGRG